MELVDHIRKISFIFFLTLGLVHFLAGFFYINSYIVPASGIINRVLFIPFVVSGVTYGLSNIKYHLLTSGHDSKKWDYTFIALGGVLLITLLVIEFLFPDSLTPLLPPL